jgi:tetratricopeptide (TPR) repeat protein
MRTKSRRTQAQDSLLAEIERELCLGRFIRYGDMFDFVAGLELVEQKLAALSSGGDAERAVNLYEAFLSGCYEKIEECDDSGGYLGMFWNDLFCGWVKARQAAGRPSSETVQQILKWKEGDNYGFCYDIEKNVAKVLNPEAYEALVAHYRKTVENGLAGLSGQKPCAIFEYDNSIRFPAMTLKEMYRGRGDVASYAALCARIGLSPKDCEHLAEMEKAKRRWKQALAWIERGLELETTRNWHNEAAFLLSHMKPQILSRLGRKEDALAQAWSEFQAHPTDMGYEEFMRYVPKAERKKWHEQAMEAAKAGGIGSFMDICVKTKEWTRLADRVHAATHEELAGVSHYHSEAAADKLVKRNDAAAAKLYRAMGFRILNAKKSKYYENALANFENARDLYRKAGLESEWAALVETVRAEHARKYGFMPGFEKITSGGSLEGPSFAERARARWAHQMGTGGS